MDDYRRHVNQRYYQNLRTTRDLHRWSVERPQDFWTDLYDFLKLTPRLPAEVHKAYDDAAPMSSKNIRVSSINLSIISMLALPTAFAIPPADP